MSLSSATTPILEARDVHKRYIGGDGNPLDVLQGVDLTVHPGEMVAIVGASGSGKSTLLHLLGALDRPTSGEVLVAGQAITGMEERALAAIRNQTIGFVFQFHHLLRELSAFENVMVPMRIGGVPVHEARSRANALLERVGLGGRLHHRPSELSGGEQQRAAVARALAANPSLLLADEPSGNLDHDNGERLHVLLTDLVRDVRVGLVVVTHNRSLAERAHRVYKLDGGRLALTQLE